MRGKTLVVLEPVTMENLRAKNGLGGGKALIAVDELGAAEGPDGGVYRGARGSESFLAHAVPVDAYCSLIVDID